MDKFIEIVSGYGPFPLGILVGVMLAKAAYSQALEYLERVNTALTEEKKQLRETIEAQQTRIDLLHDEAYNRKKIGAE